MIFFILFVTTFVPCRISVDILPNFCIIHPINSIFACHKLILIDALKGNNTVLLEQDWNLSE